MVDPQCGSSDMTQSTEAKEMLSEYSTNPKPLIPWK